MKDAKPSSILRLKPKRPAKDIAGRSGPAGFLADLVAVRAANDLALIHNVRRDED